MIYKTGMFSVVF